MSEAILIRDARVLTLQGDPVPRRGDCMSDLGVVDRADVLVQHGKITKIAAGRHASTQAITIEAQGRVLMPAFVDCHTHACWAGDRLDEWELKQRGATYLELLKAGGGIMSTVRSVRAATESDLVDDLLERLELMLRHGTTAVEVKSGYGLSTADELKMLSAIVSAGQRWEGQVSPTACIGHAFDPDVDPQDFVRKTVEETLPAVSTAFPGITIDAYCEEGAWSVGQCMELFSQASDRGHPIRVHADQFNDLGMIPRAIEHAFVSVDHLEATHEAHLSALAKSDLMGVMLPCSGFHVDGRYAAGRRFIDEGGKLAIATNYNPGSAPCPSVPMAIALAVRNLGVTAAEAILASTVNAASLLGLPASKVEEGAAANLVLLHHRDERQLGYEFGGNPVAAVICEGRLVPCSSSI